MSQPTIPTSPASSTTSRAIVRISDIRDGWSGAIASRAQLPVGQDQPQGGVLAALTKTVASPVRVSDATLGSPTLSLAYLFPGMLGEDRRLRQLQIELSRSLVVEPLHYPDIASPTALLSDMRELSRALYDSIVGREAPVGGVVLIGYSFGGCVAAEVARLLAAEGYDVKGVIIIDAPLPAMTFDLFRAWPKDGLSPRIWTKRWTMRIVEAISFNRKVRLTTLGLCGWIRPTLRRKMDRWMCKALRERARRSHWTPAVLDSPGLVIVSTQFADATSEGWQRLCPRMDRVTVAADHISILEGPALTEVVRAIVDWVSPLGDEVSRRVQAEHESRATDEESDIVHLQAVLQGMQRVETTVTDRSSIPDRARSPT